LSNTTGCVCYDEPHIPANDRRPAGSRQEESPMNRSERVALVVDDEADIRDLLAMTLQRMGIEVSEAATLTDARRRLTDQPVSICLTDMRLPDGNGLQLVEHIQRYRPEIPVAVITAHGSMDSAIQALKLGAFDFVTKPVDLQVLRDLINAALRLAPGNPTDDGHGLLGNAASIVRLRQLIAKVARSQAPIYISGESGTGKELVARLIHQQGPRASSPFVPVNCGAIPGELMESEFFGHQRGSFSGAHQDRDGLFQAAHGGTLFLDEVAELPLAMQVKLLRAIQERAIRPVGAAHEMAVDARIVCATHKDLASLVASGDFRQDLFYRLNVIELAVPPLRERREDIPLLAGALLDRLADDLGGSGRTPRLTAAAVDALQHHPFPGNVRELENMLERAVTLIDGDLIDVDDLLFSQESQSSGGGSLDNYLESIERSAILDALSRSGNNKTAAARLLGISFRSLRYKLKKLAID
jgi:two-component system response regulator PilR (NtrC family)